MVNSRFSVAIHILSLIATTSDKSLLTSDFIAGSVNTNPVVVRRMIGVLKKAGLLLSHSGVAGYELLVEPKNLTLLAIYQAIDGPEQLFAIHDEPNPACAVGREIQHTLEDVYTSIWQAMEAQLQAQTLQDVLDQLRT
ncbi:Rrf2 family transcriptional regulator [Lysinibacillus fusiformis]|jgi:DNA-binding IscR family transcriptional regulator|uniref:Transcriptional regulator n=1 Tax=Lysinibacillus fusiformis TaxID=28031 RepID=A0A1E4R6S8_9BACI|nr:MULTISPECIES: Rrf2 family transcriptional regulator [Lysinibacillus]AJK88011.1 transcriptional regulator [Lysinibacillus fusiformis]KAB0442641.1 Rrf2 family transcriptional regulator [Lysinibacillus fusiformis]KEK10977.1 transcriptional regulator [Lysinibacillus sphaericus]KGA83907.1 transcriptional regulator [Lysinibacillus fusiformis]KHK53446.1 transcriptional regulator [Lysinibacillus sp. A1]